MKAVKIEGTIALVTGANRGLGRALTEALLVRGIKKVYATARNPGALSGFHDKRVVVVELDVTNSVQIQAAIAAAPDLQLVFNNAGAFIGKGIADLATLDQARREMEVNYFGPLQLLQRLAPGTGQKRRWRSRQHRIGGGFDQRAIFSNIQRLQGCTALTDASRSDAPQSSGYLGLRCVCRPH